MDNIFCIECGFELPSTAKFCKKCGVQIEASESPPKKKIVQAEDVARHQYYGRESIVKPNKEVKIEESEIITKAKVKAKSEGKTILIFMVGILFIMLLVLLAYTVNAGLYWLRLLL